LAGDDEEGGDGGGRGGVGVGCPEVHRDGAAFHRQRNSQKHQCDLVERRELQAGGQGGHIERVVLGEQHADGGQHRERADGAQQRVLEARLNGDAVVNTIRHEGRARQRADFQEDEEIEQVAGDHHAQDARDQQEQHRVESLEAGLLRFGGERIDRDAEGGERGNDGHQRAHGIHLEHDADGEGGIRRQGLLRGGGSEDVEHSAGGPDLPGQRQADSRGEQGAQEGPGVAGRAAGGADQRHQEGREQGSGNQQRR